MIKATWLYFGKALCNFAVPTLASFLVISCSSVTYTRIASPEEDQRATGFRYFDSAPYILMTKDITGHFTAQLVYLPDQTTKSQAKPSTFLAINTDTFTYDKTDVLLGASAEIDTTAVPVAIVQAAAQVATTAAKGIFGLGAPQPKPGQPSVWLFKIVKHNGQWALLRSTVVGSDAEIP
jgi:hypothetical protein